MNIYGEQVCLRALEEKDCAMLLKLINDPETERMIGGYSFPTSELAQRDWLLNRANGKDVFRCAVVEKNGEDIALGTVILSGIDFKNAIAEIHIKMDADRGRDKGFGTDAIKAIVQYAFDNLRLNCIYATILSYNDASKHLFEKCGFKCEGLLRARLFKNGEYCDVYSYSITKADMK